MATKCDIIVLGKRRNGKPKYWCRVHKRFAWDKEGNKLEPCPGYFEEDLSKERSELALNLDDYPGGVGIWGFLHPVYDTTTLPSPEVGVHVHARRTVNAAKEIDTTYDIVRVIKAEKVILSLDGEDASAYTLSVTAGFRPVVVKCTHCGALHTDKGYLAVFPHKKHWCDQCGRDFFVPERNIGNKIAVLREKLYAFYKERQVIPTDRALSISQIDYPGGIRLWASNPAILWTVPRPEEAGIHLHAYDAHGEKVIDETYGRLEIDGVLLDPVQIRYYMAQSNVERIKKRVAALACPKCGQPHFDQGEKAFQPHVQHTCAYCGHRFENAGRLKKVVSNPIVASLTKLAEML